MSRRLKFVKACATCGTKYQPFTAASRWCSRRCFKIFHAQRHPELYRMEAATTANAERRLAQLETLLEGLTKPQSYTKGYTQGYATCHQKWMRVMRKRA